MKECTKDIIQKSVVSQSSILPLKTRYVAEHVMEDHTRVAIGVLRNTVALACLQTEHQEGFISLD